MAVAAVAAVEAGNNLIGGLFLDGQSLTKMVSKSIDFKIQ